MSRAYRVQPPVETPLRLPITGMPTAAAVVAGLAPAELRGRYQGVFTMSWGVAFAVAPLLGGEVLARLGYELEPFGGRSVIVHAVPAPHARFDAARCLKEMVADLAGGRFGGLTNPLARFASTFACRAAIKAGQALTDQEMSELVDRLFASELPAHDVHGRPTIVQLPKAELERRFGRRFGRAPAS